jgi:RNA-directed DNA polymerase
MDRRTRFVRNIAAGMLAGEWSAPELRTAIHRATGKRPAWAAPLVARLLEAHPAPPAFGTLVASLGVDAALARALDKYARATTDAERFPIHTLFFPPSDPPRPVPEWASQLPRWRTEEEVATALGLPLPQLLWLADPTGRNPGARNAALRTYRAKWVPKRSGGARLLEVPTPLLRRSQRRLLNAILNPLPPHPAAHGFRVGRSPLTNATEHCGRAVVLKFDLADFFPSIPAPRVFALFRSLAYPDPVVRLLGALCTTRLRRADWNARPTPATDGSEHTQWVKLSARHLPQGAPTSPALANLIARRLDVRLAGLAQACGATYTRYADDLTFSGGDDLRRAAGRFERRVVLIAAEEGFAVNRRKTTVRTQSERQTVTGLVVNAKPNAPRAEFDLLKAILTNCARHGAEGQNRAGVPDFRAHLLGRVAQVSATSAARGAKLRALFARVVWPLL